MGIPRAGEREQRPRCRRRPDRVCASELRRSATSAAFARLGLVADGLIYPPGAWVTPRPRRTPARSPSASAATLATELQKPRRSLRRGFASECLNVWSGRRDSNARPSAWKADALPTELRPHHCNCITLCPRAQGRTFRFPAEGRGGRSGVNPLRSSAPSAVSRRSDRYKPLLRPLSPCCTTPLPAPGIIRESHGSETGVPARPLLSGSQ